MYQNVQMNEGAYIVRLGPHWFYNLQFVNARDRLWSAQACLRVVEAAASRRTPNGCMAPILLNTAIE